MLSRIVERNPAFANVLQTIAQEAKIESGGIQRAVNVYGGKVDQAAGVNTGTMNYTPNDSKSG